MIRIGLVIFGLIACCQMLMSQDKPINPFDIKGRRPAIISDSLLKVNPATSTQTEFLYPQNRVEVDSSSLESIDTFEPILETSLEAADSIDFGEGSEDSVLQVFPEASFHESESSDEEPPVPVLDELTDLTSNMTNLRVSRQNILLIFTILSLLLLAVLLTINRSMVNKSYRAIANDNYLRFLYREYTSMPWLYWLFYFLFILNMGFFLYLVVAYFGLSYESSLPVLLACLGLVVVVYLGKHMVLNLLGSSFPIEKETHLYGFVTMLVNSLLGLVLVLVNLLVAFGPDIVSGIAVWVGICAISLMYLFRLLKGLFISGRFIAHYQFHFFLYLCSAEIAPLLILSKIALVNFGQH